jgi:hypothetical protein
MDFVSWFLQLPPTPRSTSTGSRLSSRSLRYSLRASGPDDRPRQKNSRTVSWNTHVEVWRQTSRSVLWNTHIEVSVIPARPSRPREGARERAPDDCDPRFDSTATDRAPDDCDPRLEIFEDDERIIFSSFEGNTLPPCALCSDESNGLESGLEAKGDTVG